MIKSSFVKQVRTGLFIVLFLVMGHMLSGQRLNIKQIAGGDLNAISTAVPFITITPDSRAGALGDAGVATRPDMNSQHWNVAKYPFIERDGGLSVSYTPWLKELGIDDINLAYLSAFYKPTSNQVISGSLRYFSLGQIVFTNAQGGIIKPVRPFEMAVDAGYSRLFSDNFSGGITFRYIHSNLTMNYDTDSRPGIAVASDLGFYYQDDVRLSSGNDGGYAFGIALTNLGTPISYSDDSDVVPLPSNMRLGGRFDYDIDEYNSMSFILEFNKLLVPSPPERENDSVVRGYAQPESIVLGMIQSFYDAPGIRFPDGSYSSGFREELSEIMVSAGIEYWYSDLFAIRSGYFHESSVKGNRKYFTLGIGLKLNVFALDFAYLLPVNGQSSPLYNTLRFTLGFDFENLKL